MLHLTLNKDDYVMVGDNIRIEYVRNKSKDLFSISISAPKDMKILRSSIYEGEIDALASDGDTGAQRLKQHLTQEAQERKAKSEFRRTKRAASKRTAVTPH